MDKQAIVSNLFAIGALFLVSLLLGSCTIAIGQRSGCDLVDAYVADMISVVNGARTSSRIFVHAGKLRLEARGGRRTSVMIVRYDLGRLWMLVPDESRFKELPLGSMGTQVPHFFDPRINIRRQLITREALNGRESAKFHVRVSTEGGPSYDGYLWEAGDLPGFPLRWEDRQANSVVSWENVRLQAVSRSMFLVPAHYSEICADDGGVIGRTNRCSKKGPLIDFPKENVVKSRHATEDPGRRGDGQSPGKRSAGQGTESMCAPIRIRRSPTARSLQE